MRLAAKRGDRREQLILVRRAIPYLARKEHRRIGLRWLRLVVKSERDAEVTRPGFEPGLRESKSLVLPLHYRAIRQTFDCANTLRILWPINNRE